MIQMVWQLYIHAFLNEVDESSFILNNWCIEYPYKIVDMCATSFLNFNTFGIIFCFTKGPSSMVPLEIL